MILFILLYAPADAVEEGGDVDQGSGCGEQEGQEREGTVGEGGFSPEIVAHGSSIKQQEVIRCWDYDEHEVKPSTNYLYIHQPQYTIHIH